MLKTKKNKRNYIVTPARYVCVVSGVLRVSTLWWGKSEQSTVKFLDDALNQARRYCPELIPVVSVKARGQMGLILIWEEEDMESELPPSPRIVLG